MALAELDAPAKAWSPQDVKDAYVFALVAIEQTTARVRPKVARSSYSAMYVPDEPSEPARRQWHRYTAEQIAWAEFVLFGGTYHGCDPVRPWADGILSGSVTRDAFEAWCAEMAARRPERRPRAMSEIAIGMGLSLATFNRYVSGAARMIAKELILARVVV